jgi:hypothetical protein
MWTYLLLQTVAHTKGTFFKHMTKHTFISHRALYLLRETFPVVQTRAELFNQDLTTVINLELNTHCSSIDLGAVRDGM